MSNPPSVHHWLAQHPSVGLSVMWETTEGIVEPYLIWPSSRVDDLQHAFEQAWNLGSVGLTDPPPNVLHPSDHEAPTTALSQHDARWLYLASVAQSLAVEIGNRVPWSVNGYSVADLRILFDSRELYTWSAAADGYQIHDIPGGIVVPASPHRMHRFLKDNDLIGEHRHGTITRTLKWCHDHMSHFLGGQTTKVFEHVWQYRGAAPVLRTITGTKDHANPDYGVRHWTAGCHGTAGFLRAVLRTVNIPVVHDHQASHALPFFSVDHLHLSHGDDPYNGYAYSKPQYSMSELLLDQGKFDSWFGSGVSEADKERHVGKRVQELALEYLPTSLLHDYCVDKSTGVSHAAGTVKANLVGYTVAQLEAHHLWSKMDAKIASMGGCDQIP
jgi:hypothetical protein